MDWEQIVSLIGSLGFPIVMCFIMLYVFEKLLKEQNEQHKEEMTKRTDALNNNTKVLSDLQDMVKELRASYVDED